MPADVVIQRRTSTGPIVDLTITDTRASTSDSNNPGTSNPIPIPAAGTNYSYWVTTRLRVDTTAPSGTIDNLRWFATNPGSGFGTGVTCQGAKASTGADAGYRQAVGTPGSTGTQLTQVNHTGLDEAPAADVFTFTTGSPKVLAGSISNPNTGQFGDHWVYQLSVVNTAGPGFTASVTFTWRYDET